MKLNGIVGKGSGKLGASVFAISGGEQIVRQYNPQVTNPSTDAQVSQRAKLKLMSQLAAALAPGLGFKKMGLVSARNQFVSKNIGLCDFTENQASIVLEQLQLSPGSTDAPVLAVTRAASSTGLVVDLSNANNSRFSGIVLVSVERVADNNLRVLAVDVATASSGVFPQSKPIAGSAEACIVYAYGVVSGLGNAKATYGNTSVSSDETDAILSADIMTSIRNSTLSATNAELVAEQG